MYTNFFKYFYRKFIKWERKSIFKGADSLLKVYFYLHYVYDASPSRHSVSVHGVQQTLGDRLKQIVWLLQESQYVIVNSSLPKKYIKK